MIETNRIRSAPCSRRKASSREEGTILLAAMIMVALVSSLSAALFSASYAEMKQTQNTQNRSQFRFMTDGAFDVATKDALEALANFQWIPDLEGEDIPTWTNTATVTRIWEDGGNVHTENVTVPYRVQPAFFLDETGAREYISRIETDAQGVQTLIRPYVVTIPDPNVDFEYRDIIRKAEHVIEVGMTPIFQYAVFYGSDLEMLPGPSMTLSGRVHANGDIYVGVGNGKELTIDSDYFRCSGHIYRKRKNDGSLTDGLVKIKKTGSLDFFPLLSKGQLGGYGIPSESGFDSNFVGYDGNGDGDIGDPEDYPDFTVGALTVWDGTVQTAAHGVGDVVPPSVDTIKMYEPSEEGDWYFDDESDDWVFDPDNGTHTKGRYFAEADLTIVDGVARDRYGNIVTLPSGVVTETYMYDGRENKYVVVTEVDMELLGNSPAWPDNGLLYVGRTDSDHYEPNGVRLKNGAELATRLTVVSENPLYVWGDYNSESKKPAAIMSDAVNLLSNAWDNTKGPGELPTAEETTYNFAMVTGSYETTPGDYNGGFENLPRFHEYWTGIKANIRGSFVNIYESEIAKGRWGDNDGDNYRPPNRNWDYDTDFNDASFLPPFTPNVAEVKSVIWSIPYDPLEGP